MKAKEYRGELQKNFDEILSAVGDYFDLFKNNTDKLEALWLQLLDYVGVGNDSAPVTDAGVYLSTQMKALSASVGGNDYGQTPTTNQSVNSARYLAGAFNYRSDRQDGSVGQSANARRLGPCRSRRVHRIMSSTDGDELVYPADE